MKKVIFIFLFFILSIGFIQAQDIQSMYIHRSQIISCQYRGSNGQLLDVTSTFDRFDFHTDGFTTSIMVHFNDGSFPALFTFDYDKKDQNGFTWYRNGNQYDPETKQPIKDSFTAVFGVNQHGIGVFMINRGAVNYFILQTPG